MTRTDERIDFIDQYVSWIRDNFSQVSIGDSEEITTPFLDSHNDHIQFYITRTENGYILTDDGYIINDLIMCGCDISSKKRRALMLQLAESLGVTIENNCISVDATKADIARKQHLLIQAMLKIGDMFLTSSSRVKGIFLDDVDAFFTECDIRNTPSIMIPGQSGLSHRFDFVIPKSKTMPERVVITINTPTKQSVESAIFAWTDSSKTRPKENRGYIVLNDSKKPVSQELISAIETYGITPICWKQRDKYIQQLAS